MTQSYRRVTPAPGQWPSTRLIRRVLGTLLLLLLPQWVGALSLQALSVASFLGQPLDARIAVTDLGDTAIRDLRVSLADEAAFRKAGLERTPTLSTLRFKPMRGPDGRYYIRVTSQGEIREPSLDFLIRVDWPGGSLLKSYSLLLDPPAYRPAVTRLPAPAKADEGGTDTTPATPVGQANRRYGPVRNAETLWVIAERTRPDQGISIEQMMMALQRANPHAFRRGNVNLLRRGVVLEIPAREFITRLSKRQARARFMEQTRAWRAGWAQPETAVMEAAAETGTETKTGTGTGTETISASAPATGEPVPEADGARLQVVEAGPEWQVPAAEAADSKQPAGDDGKRAELQRSIDVSRNDLATVRSINHDLKVLGQVLEQRIAKLRSALKAREQEIGRLRQRLAQSASVRAPAAAAPPATPVQAPAPREETRGVVVTETAVVPGRKPVPQPGKQPRHPPGKQGTTEWLTAYWMPLAGGAVLLLSLLLVLLIRRRRSGPGEVPNPDDFGSYMDLDETRVVTGPVVDREREKDSQDASDGMTQGSFPPGAGTDVASALTEADIYLAYRRYSQAEGLIEEAIQFNPKSWLLKAKLLEIYAFRKDRKRFSQLLEQVQPRMSVEAPQIWAKVVELGRGLVPDHPLIVDARLPEEIAREAFGDGLDAPLDIQEADLSGERPGRGAGEHRP